MRPGEKKLTDIILSYLLKKNEITLKVIAKQSGLSPKLDADRRLIQRALATLIKEKKIVAIGQARSRIYRLNDSIELKKEKKIFINYNFDFLDSYLPNQTSYLNESLCNELMHKGQSTTKHYPAGTYTRTILNRLLIDLSWNSSRLEGNTYSLLETKRLLEMGEPSTKKAAIETQMILNHKEAIEFIVGLGVEEKITSHDIRSIHALLSENLLGDPSASGRLRTIAVGIIGTSYIPLDNPQQLKEYFDIFIKKYNLIKNPFEQSFFALVHLSYLQAFEDVNKRTARLVGNIPFIKHNLKPLSFVGVDSTEYAKSLIAIYEKNDIALFQELYIKAYKRSAESYSALQQSLGEPNLFKLKYRNQIHEIVRTIVLNNISGDKIVPAIKKMISQLGISEEDSAQLFHVIEVEIISLHDGNIARFKIKPSQWLNWKKF